MGSVKSFQKKIKSQPLHILNVIHVKTSYLEIFSTTAKVSRMSRVTTSGKKRNYAALQITKMTVLDKITGICATHDQ
jgi:hypothetical protein